MTKQIFEYQLCEGEFLFHDHIVVVDMERLHRANGDFRIHLLRSMKDWCVENFGVAEMKPSNLPGFNMIFGFKSKQEAMQFKLRFAP